MQSPFNSSQFWWEWPQCFPGELMPPGNPCANDLDGFWRALRVALQCSDVVSASSNLEKKNFLALKLLLSRFLHKISWCSRKFLAFSVLQCNRCEIFGPCLMTCGMSVISYSLLQLLLLMLLLFQLCSLMNFKKSKRSFKQSLIPILGRFSLIRLFIYVESTQ